MPTPIAAFGNNAGIGGAVKDNLLPEYESKLPRPSHYFTSHHGRDKTNWFSVVHASIDLATALAEIPALAGGDASIKPASGLGTNATSGTTQIPKAVIVGGAVPAEELAQIKAAVSLPVVQVTKEQVAAAGGTGPDPALIAKLVKEALVAVGV